MALRVPIRLNDCYVSLGDEHLLFPDVSNYLNLNEVLAVYPSGIATHDSFQYNGFQWYLLKRCAGGGGGSPNLHRCS